MIERGVAPWLFLIKSHDQRTCRSYMDPQWSTEELGDGLNRQQSYSWIPTLLQTSGESSTWKGRVVCLFLVALYILSFRKNCPTLGNGQECAFLGCFEWRLLSSGPSRDYLTQRDAALTLMIRLIKNSRDTSKKWWGFIAENDSNL